MTKNNAKAYWSENIRYVLILLAIWFLVSYGAGILFKENSRSILIYTFLNLHFGAISCLN